MRPADCIHSKRPYSRDSPSFIANITCGPGRGVTPVDSVRVSIDAALADRYAIEHELGSGAMALVFLAHDLKHDRWVAIKVLKPDIATAIGADRFHREIEVVARLTHPHILSLHDSGEAAGLLYFVMPYVEGESVREQLQRDKHLSVPEATRIAREMADALEYAHLHGVVHRDVKPANIMLSSGHALLADFGIARLVEGADETLTGTGITVGTPAYMSPEQISGDEPLDGRSDVYSLGCVLYEMLTGHPPFTDASRRAVLVHHMVDSPPDVRSETPDVPRELAGIVRVALQKEPQKRFESAAALSTALSTVRSDIDITNGARLRRSLKRRGSRLGHWRRLGAIAALILLAIGIPAILRTFIKPAEPAFAREDPRGSYAVVAFDRSGQTEEEVELSARAADLLAFYLDGWDRVDATLEHELAGTKLELGLQGPALPTLEDALRLTRSTRVGTLIGVRTRVLDDGVHFDARQYDVETGEPLGPSTQVRAASRDLQALVMPVAAEILELRGENPDALKQESGSQQAWQQFLAARSALYDWRLEEAELGFRAAIDSDPGFARAQHYLAVTLFWETSRDIARRTELLPSIQRISTEAQRLASTAELNPALERHIGGLHSFVTGDYESARTLFGEQLETDPTDTEALLFLGVVEWTDPWLAEGSEPPQPRGDINLARQAFETSSRLWPEFQLSRGMQFEITGDLSDYWRGPMCPMFLSQSNAPMVVAPYEDPFDSDWVALYPILEGDSIDWVRCEDAFDWEDKVAARREFVSSAEKLYEESIADIERWARFAPDQARPQEEWADLVLWWRSRLPCDSDTSVANELTREALSHLDAALALSADTAPKLKIDHAVLRMAAGLADAVETARLVDGALLGVEQPAGEPFATPSWAAANAYLAAGQPSRAIDHMRAIWANEGRSAEDPSDPEIRHEHGDVFQHMGEIRVLGATGATGPRLDAAVAEVNWAWSAPSYPDPERRRAVLRQSSSLIERSRAADIRPALALDPEARKLWFSEWGDLEENIPDVWRGLLALDHGPDSAAVWLAPAVERLEAMRRPYATEYFITGLLAQEVGDHQTAADLFGRIQTCPQRIGLLDVGWGLTRLGRLYRARSLERLGREEEAAAERSRVEAEWAEAEPECAAMLEE